MGGKSEESLVSVRTRLSEMETTHCNVTKCDIFFISAGNPVLSGVGKQLDQPRSEVLPDWHGRRTKAPGG